MFRRYIWHGRPKRGRGGALLPLQKGGARVALLGGAGKPAAASVESPAELLQLGHSVLHRVQLHVRGHRLWTRRSGLSDRLLLARSEREDGAAGVPVPGSRRRVWLRGGRCGRAGSSSAAAMGRSSRLSSSSPAPI